MLVTDVVFNPVETRLLQEAKGLGLATLDGLSMLVHQGVFAFELWTGEQAPIAVMKQALYDALNPSN
jgi:shikimate dehydrogenase